jgi:polar amino acid transport system substrate-binding protein
LSEVDAGKDVATLIPSERKLMRIRLYCQWLAAILLLLANTVHAASPASAEQRQGPACPERAIVLGLYDFGSLYHAGVGLDKDIGEQLAARSGCRFEFKVMPRGRIWQDLQGGGVDMTLSAYATPERTVFSWAVPYLWLKNMVILSKEVAPAVHSTADFISTPYLRLGIARGHFSGRSYGNFVEQLRNIARIEEVDDPEHLYGMLKAGRFQAVLAPQLVYVRYLKDSGLDGQVRIEDWDPSGARESINLLIGKKNFSQEESRRWAAILKAMTADGSLLRLAA